MCSKNNQPEPEDPARLMPRVITAAWALLATRPPNQGTRQGRGETAAPRREIDDV